ncbi:piggyBac transposable element-derived protein 3-like [Schistocerca cancellata]|uniref:piggyBac transposable element-derived protein 3-like n=1 Tax=Schistocerca cancellata TaxID=274614 RepID=UPI00211810EC|nr:piggyBac transposable element-derived protein 3-like [Schistocerca cancellata]
MASSATRDKALTDNEIIKLLETSDLSSLSDEDDPVDEPPTPPEGIGVLEVEGCNVDVTPEAPASASSSHCRPLRWRQSKMCNRQTSDDNFEEQIDGELRNPSKFFFEYFDKNFWKNVAGQTNLYHCQKNSKSLDTNTNEILSLVGIEILMGTLKLPQARLYWNIVRGMRCLRYASFVWGGYNMQLDIPLVSSNITRDRYYKLRNNLHFVNNLEDHDVNDKLWKVRPLIDAFRNKCISLPRSQHLPVDEQMIPFTGKCKMRTYVPSKLNPLGLKNFILASSDGLVLDFPIYTGKGTIPGSDQKEHGLGAGILKLLARTIPNDYNHVIYSDRFFTSSKSIQLLPDQNIFQTGTVMANRIKEVASKFKRDQELQQGQWNEYVREDQEICALKWKDNKSVTFLSSCIGSEPEGTCKRWCNTEKAKVSVKQPAIIKSYNRNMGGIDLCDRYMAYYRSNIDIRCNKKCN